MVVIFKRFQFFDNYVHIFTSSLAPNGKNFGFLGFIDVTHTHCAYEDCVFGYNFGIVPFLIISLSGDLGVFFLLK